MKQTAVEFLHSEYKRIFGDTMVDIQIGFKISDVFQQAKEMEKEQIVNAYEHGYSDSDNTFPLNTDYYKETFNTN